ncbi:beta-propeller fold lactonase family protein [Streptomyces sp. NPDC001774]
MKNLAALTLTVAAMLNLPASAGGAPAADTPVYALVVNSANPEGVNSSLSAIDTVTHDVRTTGGLGQNPTAVAVTPDGRKAYVANFGPLSLSAPADRQTVTVVDVVSGRPLREIPVGLQPVNVAVSPDGQFAYVVNSGTPADRGSVSVIDTGTDTVIDEITEGLRNPVGIAFAPDGAQAYVTSQAAGTLSVINTAARRSVASVDLGPAGESPAGVAVAPDGHRVYVAGNASGTVLAVDPATKRVAGNPIQLPAWGMPYGMALTPDGSKLYVTSSGSDEVAVVDTTTGSALPDTITVGRNPTSVAVTPDGQHAYVTSSLDDSRGVSVIDTTTDRVVRTLNTGSGPFAVAITPVP